MSPNAVTVYAEEPGEPKNDFVLDILYQDSRRIASYLSQFDDSGFLKQVTQRESASRGKKRGFKFSVGGGATILGTGGSGSVGVERGPSEEGSEASERVYDPFWTNTLTLLDFLAAAELIQPTLEDAKIGQFVNVTGSLRVHDMNTLKLMWDIPAVKRQLGLGAPSKSQTKRLDPAAKAAIEGLELGLEILKTLPHGITARVSSLHAAEVWASLQADSLAGSTGDLFLKHGDQIAGQWTMLGVLDAEPDIVQPTDFTEEENSLRIFTQGFSHILDLLGPLSRMFLGRPSGAYGMTPLVIYRKVAGS